MKLQDVRLFDVETLSALGTLSSVEPSRFTYRTSEFNYECLLRPKVGAKRLFIIFHGAKVQEKRPPPYFDRWSWAPEFPGSVLFVSDPSLQVDKQLCLSWYIGNEREWPIAVIAKIASGICEASGIAEGNVIGYGASGGGFAGLALASHMKTGGAIAINSQTNVFQYHARHVREMLKYCFPTYSDREEVMAKFGERLNMVDRYDRDSNARVLAVQNTEDAFHHQHHYLPFVNAFSRSRCAVNLRTHLYEHESGHGPEQREMLPLIWSLAFD